MRKIILPIILCLVVSACTAPGAPAPSSANSAAYTASAATIIAQLTQASGELPGAAAAPNDAAVAPTDAPTDSAAATPGAADASPATATLPGENSPTGESATVEAANAPAAAPGEAAETLPPTSTPLATRTPLPSDTPLPSNTPPASPTALPTSPVSPLALGEPVFKDIFDQAGNWPFYNSYFVEMNLQKGGLHITARIPSVKSPRDNWMVSDTPLDNFYLEAVATPHDCQRGDRYGLIFRAPADASKGYLFGVSCDGHFALRLWDGAQSLSLIPWTPSAHILRGPEQANRLGVKADGEKITLYVNGKELVTTSDDTLSSGAFGPFVGAVYTTNFTVTFDEITAWAINK